MMDKPLFTQKELARANAGKVRPDVIASRAYDAGFRDGIRAAREGRR